jgi:hypothetical protein
MKFLTRKTHADEDSHSDRFQKPATGSTGHIRGMTSGASIPTSTRRARCTVSIP